MVPSAGATTFPPALFSTTIQTQTLQMGKVHFGVVLGWSVVQSMVIWFVCNRIACADGPDTKGIDLYSMCCVTGYGMVPLILHAALALVVRK